MTGCCTTSKSNRSYPDKYACPVNGKVYKAVSQTTIMHHINKPWLWLNTDQGYYFCSDPQCDVVYFAQDSSVIEKSSLRAVVGIKEKSETAPICYCFGVNRKTATDNPAAKEFVIEQTRQHACSCSSSNPSGRCCLGNFP
jgi:hypothetical protein